MAGIQSQKTVENAFDDGQDDVLLNPDLPADVTQRHEPVFADENIPVTLTRPAEPVLTDSVESELAAEVNEDAKTVSVEKELPVDELIDCVIPLEFDTPVRGEKILAEIADLKYVGKKPVHFIGQTHSGERDVIAIGGAYTTLFAGIQMVSRSGALNELEYSGFVMKLRAIADNLNAHPDIPDMNSVISHARELHQFVAEHDAQLSVNVAATGAAWALNTLIAALEKMGFDQRPDGRLMMPDSDGGSLFTLSTNVGVSEALTSRLTLLLDVPCVAPSAMVSVRWQRAPVHWRPALVARSWMMGISLFQKQPWMKSLDRSMNSMQRWQRRKFLPVQYARNVYSVKLAVLFHAK